MPDTPRAPKRRRLDTGEHPQTPPSIRRSTRLTNGHGQEAVDKFDNSTHTKRSSKLSRREPINGAAVISPSRRQPQGKDVVGVTSSRNSPQRSVKRVRSSVRLQDNSYHRATSTQSLRTSKEHTSDYDRASSPIRRTRRRSRSLRDKALKDDLASQKFANNDEYSLLHSQEAASVNGDEPTIDDLQQDVIMENSADIQHPPLLSTASPSLGASQISLSSDYDLPRSIALSKLTCRRPTPIRHLSAQRSQVYQLLSATVSAGQGNSLLLLGSRGAGKSALVESVIKELESDPNNVAGDGNQAFHVIRLNGFVQTDDKLALREIWRQLGQEMDIEEDENTSRNYADTLASLLAVLSHPVELSIQESAGTRDIDTQKDFRVKDDRVSIAVIFLISEFDAFAARSRQTLLYNLFDVAQSRKAPIAVLGMSARMDAAEMLEKRVKSRFSQRYVYVTPPKTLEHFVDVCRSAVEVSYEELDYRQQQSLSKLPPNVLATWNAASVTLLLDDPLRIILEQLYHTTRSIPTALSALHLPIATLSPPLNQLHAAAFPAPIATLSSHKLTHITSLPSLSLALLIAGARLPLITGSDSVSFPLAYDEYRALATKARLAASSGGAQVHSGVAGRVWGKEVARAAWEGLIDAGVIIAEGGSVFGSGGAGMCKVDVALEEIEPAIGKEMDKSLLKWCREL